jgi:hypothetical protein
MPWPVVVETGTPAPGNANPDEPGPPVRTRHVPPHSQVRTVGDRLLDHRAVELDFHHVGADRRLAPERLRTNVGVAVSCPAGAVPVAAFEPSSVPALAIDPLQIRILNRARVQQDIRVVSAGARADDATVSGRKGRCRSALWGAKAVGVRHGVSATCSIGRPSAGRIASHHRCCQQYAAPALALRRHCVPFFVVAWQRSERAGVLGALAFSTGTSGLAAGATSGTGGRQFLHAL